GVAGGPQTVSRPRLHRRRHGAREQLGEGVARADGVARPERRPAARVRGPEAEGARLRRGPDDLTEQPVRRLGPPELPVRLAEPVAGLEHDVFLLTAARRLLEGLRRIVVLGLGDARLTALERRRGDPEDRAERTPHDRPPSLPAPVFPSPAGGRPSWLLTDWARSRAQSRSVASGLLLATDSYAVRAPRRSLSCSRASPRPASARLRTPASTSFTPPTASNALAAAP